MKVYVVMANDFPDCVLKDEEAAKEYVDYRKDLEQQAKDTRRRIHWRYYEFDLIYGQHR